MSAKKPSRFRGDERRRAPRLRVDAPAELLVCPASSRTVPTAVKLKDVSATGIGVELDSPLPVGQKCVVKTSALPERQSRLYTVVRAYPDGQGKFHVGMHSSQLIAAESSGVGEGAPRHSAAMTMLLLLIAGVAGGAWYFLM